MFPNFLIVGAMKAGTTTLRDYLNTVDDIWIHPGEIRFFSNDKNYARGLSWYERLFDGGAGKIAVGDKSPGYSFQPQAPERIYRCLPDVKLIWIFREPTARTYSHYWHAATRGRERLSFADAIAREPERTRGNMLRGYANRSIYVEQVERYLGFFPKTQMQFLLFEDLIREPVPVLNRVLAFLGVPQTLRVVEAPTHSNVTRAPRALHAQWLIRSLLGRSGIARKIRHFNRRTQSGYPPLSADLKEQLRQRFREPNQRLARVTGLDLSPWNGIAARAERP